MPKEFSYRGHSLEELRKMSIEEFSRLLKARARRALRRGLTHGQKKLLEKIRKDPTKFYKTHERDMIILPEMVGCTIGVHDGKQFVPLKIRPEMIGHRLGEFVPSTKRVKHSAPGVGASRSTKHIAVK
jgi:small subunit ribosomal protein S19